MQDDEHLVKVVIGVDASPGSRVAATWAIEEAGRRGAEVLAVNAWRIPSMAYSAPAYALPSPDDFSDGRSDRDR